MDYCQERGIALTQVLSSPMQREDLRQWVAALTKLTGEQQAAVELELATVSDMASAPFTLQLSTLVGNASRSYAAPSRSIRCRSTR